MNRQTLLYWAEVIDSFRVFPRLFLAVCLLWTIQLTHMLLQWYMVLPKEDRGFEASGFASVAFLTVFGFMKLVYETYSRNGRDWNSAPPTISTSMVSTTTTTGTTP